MVQCQRAQQADVPQTSSLLYRRLPVGRVSQTQRWPAGWKPATQQVGNLRYRNPVVEYAAWIPFVHPAGFGGNGSVLIRLDLPGGKGYRPGHESHAIVHASQRNACALMTNTNIIESTL
jgi:hypothetical protein